jgi:hypothetical protein
VKTDLRVVSPYRPFAPESNAHRLLGPFDWIGALRMLRASVERSCQCETVGITDADTTLPGPMFQYYTLERRLMLWILEVALCYLRSPQFDRDTVMVSPDMLVFDDLRPWMQSGHFVVLMRAKYPAHPILNAVQFWPVRRKEQIGAFYEEALAIGKTLPEGYLEWGGDTEPIRRLLAPLEPGLVMRDGKPIARLIEADEILQSFTSAQAAALKRGEAVKPVRAVLDFRYLRKKHQQKYFDLTFGPLTEVAA